MNKRELIRMYNSLARFTGWKLLHSPDSPYESNKEYQPSKFLIFPFLIK